jgi:hypothetical protein
MSEKALYSILTNDSDVAAHVSTRVYPNVAPQSASYPYIVYERVSTEPLNAIPGSLNESRTTFQLSIESDSYSECKDVADDVRDALDGYSGTAATVVVHRIYLDGESDVYDEPESGDETGVHGVQFDVIVWHAF